MNCSEAIKTSSYYSDNIYTWCTNCGNYGVHGALKRALVLEDIKPRNVVLCFDIGCHGNGSNFLSGYRVHGLHGRVIPLASGVELANSDLKVIAFGGDGGTLSEGVGHLIHAIRSNYNVVFILHNNFNYGLTTGQASSTTPIGFPMNSSPDGVTAEPIDVVKFVLGMGCKFVGRGFSGNINQLVKIIREGIRHDGFSFIEVLQNCPTYNKSTSHEWYLNNTYSAEDIKGYDNSSYEEACELCSKNEEKIPMGVIYHDENAKTFSKRLENRSNRIGSSLVDEVREYSIDGLLQKFV